MHIMQGVSDGAVDDAVGTVRGGFGSQTSPANANRMGDSFPTGENSQLRSSVSPPVQAVINNLDSISAHVESSGITLSALALLALTEQFPSESYADQAYARMCEHACDESGQRTDSVVGEEEPDVFTEAAFDAFRGSMDGDPQHDYPTLAIEAAHLRTSDPRYSFRQAARSGSEEKAAPRSGRSDRKTKSW